MSVYCVLWSLYCALYSRAGRYKCQKDLGSRVGDTCHSALSDTRKLTYSEPEEWRLSMNI